MLHRQKGGELLESKSVALLFTNCLLFSEAGKKYRLPKIRAWTAKKTDLLAVAFF